MARTRGKVTANCPPAVGHAPLEQYSPGYEDSVVESFAQRSAAAEAAFFIPSLTRRMRLLDCGSGPGTITLGLARVVDAGEVVGLDIDSDQVDRATELAAQKGVENVSFQTGSVYSLPFESESFDAVFAHAVLQHLKEPVLALREMRRVLRPGGVVGVRDDDVGTLVVAPPSIEMSEVLDLLQRVTRVSGGNPNVGRRYKELLKAAGFVDVAMSATAQAHGETTSTAEQGEFTAALLEHMEPIISDAGWASADRVKYLAEFCRRWGTSRDAFDVITWCEAVGHR